MAGTIKKLVGPVALTTTMTTNIFNDGSALLFSVVKHIHVANKLAADTFRLYLGATGANAAGTELFFDYPVGAKLVFDWYTNMKMLSTDFLVGGAATTLTLTITVLGEQYVV
jgi:hypothetical protein